MRCSKFSLSGFPAVILSTFLIIGLLVLPGCTAPPEQDTDRTPISSVPLSPAGNGSILPEGLAGFEKELAAIYASVNPSVVNIQISADDVPFPSSGRDGMGSGFVWDREGHIVTNEHVVSNAGRITVTFYDDIQVPATVVGTDSGSDLAVVKVDVAPEQLHPVEMADFDTLRVGHMAIAIGNPFGLQGTLTVGVVSSLGRLLPARASPGGGGFYSIPDIIQTDASLNPGNSGGVLVNSIGQVIGVPSAIIPGVEGSAGVGFAIPAPIVAQVVPALISDGRYEYSWLGVSVTSLHPDLARAMEMDPQQRGALVVTVQEGSPAARSGLQGNDRMAVIQGREAEVGGDVIIAINDRPVRNSDDLITYQVRHTRAGDVVKLTILRQGAVQTIEVTLGTRPRT